MGFFFCLPDYGWKVSLDTFSLKMRGETLLYKSPGRDVKDCLLLECAMVRQKGGFVEHDPKDFQITAGPENIKKYFSDTFSETGEVQELLDGVDEIKMKRIVSEVEANGYPVRATLYFCDIGPGRGMSVHHYKSKSFMFPAKIQ